MEHKDTTVINLNAHPDLVVLYRAMNDPKVAAILKSFGIEKEVRYVYQGNRRIKLPLYVITASDPEETKRLVNKLIEILPKFLDDDDKQLVNSAIDQKARQERDTQLTEGDCSETITEVKEVRVLGITIFRSKRTRTRTIPCK